MEPRPGNLLREIRRYRMHLSQAGLSRRLKVNQSTVSRVESGSKRMTRNLLYKLRIRISAADFEELKEAFDEWDKRYWEECRRTACAPEEHRAIVSISHGEGPGMPTA